MSLKRTDLAKNLNLKIQGQMQHAAIPSRFAVDFLFLRKMLARENMTPADVQIVEMPPPDMPGALATKAIDAYTKYAALPGVAPADAETAKKRAAALKEALNG